MMMMLLMMVFMVVILLVVVALMVGVGRQAATASKAKRKPKRDELDKPKRHMARPVGGTTPDWLTALDADEVEDEDEIAALEDLLADDERDTNGFEG